MFKIKDLQLLACLRENSRQRLTKISRRTQLPVSTIFDKISSYKNFARFTTIVNFATIGYTTKVHLLLKAGKDDKDRLEKYLENSENINSLYRINNGFDYMAEGIFKTIRDVEEFLDCIEGSFNIKDKEMHYVIDDIKRESFLSRPDIVVAP
ncbi:Lrp/AsnC family transcriptional regulator [Candidatus Woesearchaeota archaeon]|nr:Lrp/AsnC family transcriptional regulator [Candidatus Woesearchaeota archaeon]